MEQPRAASSNRLAGSSPLAGRSHLDKEGWKREGKKSGCLCLEQSHHPRRGVWGMSLPREQQGQVLGLALGCCQLVPHPGKQWEGEDCLCPAPTPAGPAAVGRRNTRPAGLMARAGLWCSLLTGPRPSNLLWQPAQSGSDIKELFVQIRCRSVGIRELNMSELLTSNSQSQQQDLGGSLLLTGNDGERTRALSNWPEPAATSRHRLGTSPPGHYQAPNILWLHFHLFPLPTCYPYPWPRHGGSGHHSSRPGRTGMLSSPPFCPTCCPPRPPSPAEWGCRERTVRPQQDTTPCLMQTAQHQLCSTPEVAAHHRLLTRIKASQRRSD